MDAGKIITDLSGGRAWVGRDRKRLTKEQYAYMITVEHRQ